LTKNDFLSPYLVESPSCFHLHIVMLNDLYCQHLQKGHKNTLKVP